MTNGKTQTGNGQQKRVINDMGIYVPAIRTIIEPSI